MCRSARRTTAMPSSARRQHRVFWGQTRRPDRLLRSCITSARTTCQHRVEVTSSVVVVPAADVRRCVDGDDDTHTPGGVTMVLVNTVMGYVVCLECGEVHHGEYRPEWREAHDHPPEPGRCGHCCADAPARTRPEPRVAPAAFVGGAFIVGGSIDLASARTRAPVSACCSGGPRGRPWHEHRAQAVGAPMATTYGLMSGLAAGADASDAGLAQHAAGQWRRHRRRRGDEARRHDPDAHARQPTWSTAERSMAGSSSWSTPRRCSPVRPVRGLRDTRRPSAAWLASGPPVELASAGQMGGSIMIGTSKS